MNKNQHSAKKPSGTLRLGFVPLTDCAPLVMAQELGLFAKYGLRVALSRELGWASIRDKVIYGELDAAHAVVGMPVAATLGLGSVPCDCLTALVLNLHGNAITLSDQLWRRGVQDGATLRAEVMGERGKRTFTFGAVSSFSSHYFLLRNWLAAAGIQPDRDVRIVIVPPPQMTNHLRAGHIDGFCVGEPWNTVAVQAKIGWVVAASSELDPGHPEKVLMVRREFAQSRPEEHLALIAALLEACQWCDGPENRAQLVDTLARREFVNVSPEALRRGLEGDFDFGQATRFVPGFCLFHGNGANDPSADKAAWVLRQMKACKLGPDSGAFEAGLGRRVFRSDLFAQAMRRREEGEGLDAAPVRVTASGGSH